MGRTIANPILKSKIVFGIRDTSAEYDKTVTHAVTTRQLLNQAVIVR